MLSILDIIKKKIDIFKNINLINLKKPKFVFYSESKTYQKYILLLIQLLSKKYPNEVYYVSSDKNDRIDNLNIKNIFIGEGMLRNYFFSSINAENMILTVTDLDNNLIKKTKKIKNYIYYFHAPVSTTKIYTETAFDNYEIIFCNGDYQINEIRRRELLKKIPKKKLIKTGYLYFDYLQNRIKQPKLVDEILIAPSWNYNKENFFNENFELIIEKLLKDGFKVRFRPHPENLKRSQLTLNNIKKKFINKRFIFDDDNENIKSMENAKCLITDNSGIAIEYVLLFNKPVLYFEDFDKIHNTEFNMYNDLMTMEDKVKNKFGYIFKIDDIDNISFLINKSTSEFKNKDIEIKEFINENFYNFGKMINNFDKNLKKIFE